MGRGRILKRSKLFLNKKTNQKEKFVILGEKNDEMD